MFFSPSVIADGEDAKQMLPRFGPTASLGQKGLWLTVDSNAVLAGPSRALSMATSGIWVWGGYSVGWF